MLGLVSLSTGEIVVGQSSFVTYIHSARCLPGQACVSYLKESTLHGELEGLINDVTEGPCD